MATDDKPLTQNYDSEKEKSEIDSDIRVLKIRTATCSAIPAEEIAFYNKAELSVSIDSPLCVLILFCHLLSFMDHLLNKNLRSSPHFAKGPSKDLHLPA